MIDMNWFNIIVPPSLMLIGGIITWLIKSRIEELRATEQKLRDERQKIYSEILEPIIRLFSDIGGQGEKQATKKILSFDYRKNAFDLILLVSDEVIMAYNRWLQYIYQTRHTCTPSNQYRTLKFYGDVLLYNIKILVKYRPKCNQV